MAKRLVRTGERIIPEAFRQSKEAYLLYLRHLFAYEHVRDFVSQDSSVLEIGCGEGYGTHHISNYVKRIVGLDVNEQVILYASETYQSATCTFKSYDGVTFPAEDKMYDAVVCFQVLEHIADDRAFLAEIYRVLKPDGVCLLTTPNRLRRMKANQKPWNRFHVREYTPDELEHFLATFFSKVRVFSIRGNKDIETIEETRIKKVWRLATLDPFRLRLLLPPAVESFLLATIKKTLFLNNNRSAPERKDDFLHTYSTADYVITEDDVDKSFDLLALCKKE